MKEYPEDFPWREFLKECIPFVVVLIVYFTVMAAISAPSIAWLLRSEELRIKSEELTTSSTLNSQLSTLNFPNGGAQ